MIVPIDITYLQIEELCSYDDVENAVMCTDLHEMVDVDPREAKFSYNDLMLIVDMYGDTIIGILMGDDRYKDALLKAMKKVNAQ